MKFGRTVVLVATMFFATGSANAEELTPPSAPPAFYQTIWIGFAAGYGGHAFRGAENPNEDVARAIAKNECEANVGRTCRAIAVPAGWSVSIVECNDYQAYVAGTIPGVGSAYNLALQKAQYAGSFGCWPVFNQ